MKNLQYSIKYYIKYMHILHHIFRECKNFFENRKRHKMTFCLHKKHSENQSVFLKIYFSSFQLFFQSKLVDDYMLGKLLELHHLSGYNHSYGISILMELLP